MGAFLLALAPLLAGLTQPIKDYFASKAKQAELLQQIELAKIQAEKESIVSGNQADVEKIKSYLGATSQTFRQGTFYFLILPLLFSIFVPSYAQIMWHNFEMIPDWFRILFVSVYSVIWGLPIAKEHIGSMFAALGRSIQLRRDYKLEKAAINRQAVFDELKAKLFLKGMTQQQVDIVDNALNKGEQ